MIICTKNQLSRYLQLNKNFKLIIDFLEKNDLEKIECGKYDLGDGNVVKVMESKNYEENFIPPKMEAHKKFIDVQIPIFGKELLYFDDLNNCKTIEEYNDEKDVFFVSSDTMKKCQVLTNEMMILFPEDTHYVIVSDTVETGKKAVFKIKV